MIYIKARKNKLPSTGKKSELTPPKNKFKKNLKKLKVYKNLVGF